MNRCFLILLLLLGGGFSQGCSTFKEVARGAARDAIAELKPSIVALGEKALDDGKILAREAAADALEVAKATALEAAERAAQVVTAAAAERLSEVGDSLGDTIEYEQRRREAAAKGQAPPPRSKPGPLDPYVPYLPASVVGLLVAINEARKGHKRKVKEALHAAPPDPAAGA